MLRLCSGVDEYPLSSVWGMLERLKGGCFVAGMHGFKCELRLWQAKCRQLQVVSEASKCVGGSRNVRGLAEVCQMAGGATAVADTSGRRL